MDCSGARGTLIHEKKWDRKSRVRLPLKHTGTGVNGDSRQHYSMYSIYSYNFIDTFVWHIATGGFIVILAAFPWTPLFIISVLPLSNVEVDEGWDDCDEDFTDRTVDGGGGGGGGRWIRVHGKMRCREWLKGGLIYRPGSIIRWEKVCAALPSANIIHHSSAGQRQTMKACRNFKETSSGDFQLIFIYILFTLVSESWRCAQGSRFEASRSRLS